MSADRETQDRQALADIGPVPHEFAVVMSNSNGGRYCPATTSTLAAAENCVRSWAGFAPTIWRRFGGNGDWVPLTPPDAVTITIPAAVAEQLDAWRALTQEERDEVLDDLDREDYVEAYDYREAFSVARMLLRRLA